MRRTALVVLVGEAEELVGELRSAHDPMATRGVPAHVTVLHPFRQDLDARTAEEIAAIARGHEPFEASFASVGRFPGGVVYLEPAPIERFRLLTADCRRAFPDCPPYEGRYPDPHPHLTVGSGVSTQVADQLGENLTSGLPVTSNVTALTLLIEDDAGMWTVGPSWSLAG